MQAVQLEDLVDLGRYPLKDEAAMRPLIAHSQAQLAESSFACLRGFLRPGIAEKMATEVQDAMPRAYRREQAFSAYDESTLSQYPLEHVRWRKHASRQFVIPTDILPRAGLLRSLYRSDTLCQRVAQMLGEAALFPLADPLMACTSTVMYEGDTHGWHFDLNDFVVSVLLQASESGGTFDFAPNIREDSDENYSAVQAVLDSRSDALRSIKVEAGTLLLFCGRRALHRVPPVIGKTPRIIALLSYDRKPGVRYSADAYERVAGRRIPFES